MTWGSDTSYDQALAFLHDRIGQGVKPGLERTAGLLSMLADPHTIYPIIHVAGTNGKGSTARIAAALLGAHGLKAGLFTSPHLHHVEERFEAGGVQMTPGQFAETVAEIAPIVGMFEERAGEGVTYFELTAALAFSWFAEQAVDVAVVETGLGGRLDATNAADGAVAVVTTIGREHTEFLGDTLAAIAGEKLAIVKDGATLVTGRLPDDALEVAARVVGERGSPWIRLGTEVQIADSEPADDGWMVTIEGVYDSYPDLHLRLHGRHQLDNLALAIAAVEALFGRALDPAAVAEAAQSATSPGRMEVAARDPLLMIDGAHNPPGTAALVAALREEFPGVRWRLVFGVMADKELDPMLASLIPYAVAVHAVAADYERAIPAADLAGLVERAAGGIPVFAEGTVEAGLAAARAAGGPVLVTGSLYVVGEARLALGLA